jgi:ABC-type branched-subunit amino acid transport system substrate-binding protein
MENDMENGMAIRRNTGVTMKALFFSLLLIGQASAAPAAPKAAIEHGVTDDKITIGQSAPFSGPSAKLGLQYSRGAQIYFDQVNELGGVFGRKIVMVKKDDTFIPEMTQVNAKLLISQDDVFALFGFVGAATSKAAIPSFTEAGVPFIASYSGSGQLREPFSRYIFNVRASHRKEVEAIVRQLVTVYASANSIAVFYQYDSDGWAGLEDVERALKQHQTAPVAVAQVVRNSTDVTSAVATIMEKAPSSVIMISTYTSAAAFVREMRHAGYRGQLVNLSFVGSNALLQELGKDGYGVMVSQVVPFPWSRSIAVVAEYQKAMEHIGASDFDFASLEGYIAAKVFVEGVRRAGKNLTREKFMAAMETFKKVDLGGFFISYSPTDHSGSEFVDLTLIGASGKYRN